MAETAAARTEEPRRVLVVDDHPMMRRIVCMACEKSSNLRVIGEAADGYEALQQAEDLQPDVIVLDLGIPGLDGLEVVRRLRDQDNEAKIFILTGRDDNQTVFNSLRLNVNGFLEKTKAVDNLAELIQEVANGHNQITAEHKQHASAQFGEFLRRQREVSRVTNMLSPRELQVLKLISEACTTTRMARNLGLSERTVESHIAKLYRKLGVATRTEAVTKATKLGLL